MSSASIYFRDLAAASRAKAAAERLPRRRQQHEASAERWDEMALRAEDTEQRSKANQETRQRRS